MMKTLCYTLAALLLVPLASLHAAVEVTNLRCEYRDNPLGIDDVKLRLSWLMEEGSQEGRISRFWHLLGNSVVGRASPATAGEPVSALSPTPVPQAPRPLRVGEARPTRLADAPSQVSVNRGLKQTAYQVLVASTSEFLAKDQGDLWDSGKVESDQSIHVAYAGKALVSGQQCYWKVKVWTISTLNPEPRTLTPSVWSEPALWTMGLLKPEDWLAKWITLPDPKRLAHPWLRRTFELKEGVERAMIHIDTASFYELRINGKKVTPYVLTPGVSQNNKRFLVNSYDVSPYLVTGKNCIAIWMGPGWHQPKMGNTHGSPILRAQLSVVTPSGPMVIGTDASWRTKKSCITQIGGWSWNNFGGERFDAREFVEDWDQIGLDDSQWAQAREIPAPAVAHSWQACESARLSDPIKPTEIRPLQNGKWVVDFGRPLTGWMRFKMHNLKVGQEVQIQYADIDDNRNERKLASRVNTDGFQDFNQKDIFISAGKGSEAFCSRFNYHSFRYAVIAGLDHAPSVNDAEAMLVEPDLASAGSFECSNELFNQIHEITRYTYRTQNPCLALGTGEAREKSAYGDGGAHLSGYLYNFKVDANLKKWTRDYSDAQRADGWFTHTAPAFENHGGGPAWGGQASELVRRMHLYYGDRGVVEQMYDKLRKFVDYLETKTSNDVLRSFTPTSRGEGWMFIGDWARPAATAGQGFNMDRKDVREFFNNSYRVLLWQQLQDFAKSIGRTEEVSRCEARLATIRPLVHKTFYQEDKGVYLYSSQSSLAMALYARIPPPELRPKILAQLENEIVVVKKGHLDTGLLGTFILLDLLIQENRNDLVSLIMGQTTYPGWGYLIKEMGLKTWPETWSGWGSHVILVTATPGSWFFEGLGGILPDPAKPGFKHFLLRPGIVKSVDWVKCSYQSPYGEIVSNWKSEKDSFKWEIHVPVNSTATIYLPTTDPTKIKEGNQPLSKAKGVKFLHMENGAAVYAVGSGTYQFQSTISETIK
jgi:alpha-L-rhamnosidase